MITDWPEHSRIIKRIPLLLFKTIKISLLLNSMRGSEGLPENFATRLT